MPKSDFICNFIEITLQHGCSPVNLLHIFRTPFSKNDPGWLLPELLSSGIIFVVNMYIIA